MKKAILHAAVAAVTAVLISASAAAADWGSIKGRIKYDGKPPAQDKLLVNKDVAVCARHHPVDESLVVAEDGGLANVFVYIRLLPGKKLDVHPDYDKLKAVPISLDNKWCRYEPHAACLWTEQPLELKNSDVIGHNVKADFLRNASFNVLIPPGGTVEQRLYKGESIPMPVGCNIHPWMSAKLLVREDPYMAVSAVEGDEMKAGTFEIKNIPAGTYTFQLWHEKAGYLDGAKVQDKPAAKGRFELTIRDGTLDLGDIVVSPKVFEK